MMPSSCRIFVKQPNQPVFPDEVKPYLVLYHFDHGDIICTQGEPAEMLYVLVEGKLKSSRHPRKARRWSSLSKRRSK